MNDGLLIVKAYAFAKIQNSSTGISVNITKLSSPLNTRLLQEDVEVPPIE